MNGIKFKETDTTFADALRSKRTRCSNFTAQEKNVLIHIIEKYEFIVECKKTDKQSILKKERLWDTIAEEFNEILGPDSTRTARQLKLCYENLKKRLRNKSTDEKCKQNGELQPPNWQTLLSVDRTEDVELELNSSTDTIRPSLEESCGAEDSRSCPGARASVPGPPDTGLAALRRVLLRKEIALADLDLKMRARKYRLELRVHAAKLGYYRRKTALLSRAAPGTDS